MRIYTFFSIFCMSIAPASADVFSDAWGILTDPLKVGEASDNAVIAIREARDALIAMERLQEKNDSDIRFYLRDVDGKIDRMKNASIEVVDSLADEIRSVEDKIVRDIVLLVRKAECSLNRTSDQAIRQSVRDTLPSWLVGDERVFRLPFGVQKKYALGVIPWGTEPKTHSINLRTNPNPFEIFKEFENAYLENLKESKESDDAILIYSAWANLARLSKLTACFYEGQQFEKTLIKKHAKYNAMVFAWNFAVKVKE